MTLKEMRYHIYRKLLEREVPERECIGMISAIWNEEMAERILKYLNNEPMSTRTRTVINEISMIVIEYDEENWEEYKFED